MDKLTLRLVVATVLVALVVGDYESAEEEQSQPNLLNEVNNNFVCQEDGYFADVTYGCQYYHVCGSSNSPYDKPSFVKHTFSCVNGTVFNQMSFTCTRHSDSIPCEASPKYFYLNKRNGDPKAHFLTDEDITSSLTHSLTHHHQQQTSAGPPPPPPTPAPTFSPPSTTSASDRYFASFENRETKPIRKFISSHLDPMPKKKAAVFHRDDHPSNNLYGNNDNSYSEETNHDPINPIRIIKSPEQFSKPSDHQISKYLDNLDDNSLYTNRFLSKSNGESSFLPKFKPGVKYSPKARSKYESLGGGGANRLVGYSSVNINNQVSAHQHHQMPSEHNNHHGHYNDQQDNNEPDKRSFDIPAPFSQNSKKSELTPAVFSKMYMENVAKYQNFQSNSEESENQRPKGSLLFSKPREASMYMPRLNQKMPAHEPETSIRQTEPVYHKPNRYIVPSSVRIIEQGGFQKRPTMTEHQEKPSPSIRFIDQERFEKRPTMAEPQEKSSSPIRIIEQGGYQKRPEFSESMEKHDSIGSGSTTSHQEKENGKPPSEPVRISFYPNKQSSSEHNPGQDSEYGNLRFVKEVKGKSLLIDPTLEKDPARDNIIAKVLEMLNNYN